MSCSTALINSVSSSVIERLPRLHCCFQGSQSLGLPSSLHLSFLYLLPTSYTKTFISGAFERSAAFYGADSSSPPPVHLQSETCLTSLLFDHPLQRFFTLSNTCGDDRRKPEKNFQRLYDIQSRAKSSYFGSAHYMTKKVQK